MLNSPISHPLPPEELFTQLIRFMEKTRPDLRQILKRIEQASEGHAGYPYTLPHQPEDIARALCLAPFLMHSMNNLGEAFKTSRYNISVAKEEQQLLQQLAILYKLQLTDLWGSVVSSGTEGNFLAMAIAKKEHPRGKIYYSDATHYSIKRAAQLLDMPHQALLTTTNDEIDYQALDELVSSTDFNQSPIFNLNFGTTFTNATDSAEKVISILRKYNVSRYYIHYDGALAGGMRPFMRFEDIVQEQIPDFSFEIPINSLTVSGHKWFGSQVCGVILARKSGVHMESVEYTGSTTTLGSRNALAILDLWDRVVNTSHAVKEHQVSECLKKARYFESRLAAADYPQVSRQLNTIVLKRPSPEIADARQLAVIGDLAHYIVMPNHSYQDLDRFLNELTTHSFCCSD